MSGADIKPNMIPTYTAKAAVTNFAVQSILTFLLLIERVVLGESVETT